MKKIKIIRQLKSVKKQLKQRQTELEKAIKYDWRDLKESLAPRKVAGQVFSKVFDKKESYNGNSFIAETVSQLAATLAKRVVEKAEEKIGKWFTN